MTGMDQAALAEATGISRSTISHLELGKAPMKRSYAKLIGMATGVPVDWLETGEVGVRPTDPGEPVSSSGAGDDLARLTAQKAARVRGNEVTRRYPEAA